MKKVLDQNVTHLGLKPHVCNLCHKGFGELNKLNQHKQLYHSNYRPFQWDIPGNLSSGVAPEKLLRLQYSENYQESVDVCGVCGYVVENSKALELHWKTSHLSWTPVLNCDFCDREFYAQG